MDGVYRAMRETFDVPEDDRLTNTRSVEQKKALYARVAANLKVDPGVKPRGRLC
jgi:hypothetical protein